MTKKLVVSIRNMTDEQREAIRATALTLLMISNDGVRTGSPSITLMRITRL